MASLVLNGNTSGSVTISSPAVSGTTTLTLPTTSGTVLTNGTNTNFPAGSVLQVVSAISTVDVTTTSSATVITASITPSSASNKILTMFSGEISNAPTTNAYGYLGLARSGSSLSGLVSVGMQVAANITVGTGKNFLDSPATTSSITYTLTVGKGSGGTSSTTCTTGATITLMEIKA